MSWLTTRHRLTLTALILVLLSIVRGSPTGIKAEDCHEETSEQIHSWTTSYGGPDEEQLWSMEHTSDGGHAVIGWSKSFAGNGCAIWVLKLRANGTIQWQKTYGEWWELGESIKQTTDGGYALAGYTWSFGAGESDYWVLRLNGDGSVQWQKTYGGKAEDQATSLQCTSDGGYIVAGETESYGAGDWDIWIVKLSASGTVQWQKTYGGQGTDTSSAEPIQQTSDGGYVVTGQTNSFGSGQGDFWVLKLDADGAVQWEKTYGGEEDEYARSIRQTSDGGYVVTGYARSFGAGNWDVWVLKLDGDGVIQWQNAYGGTEWEFAYSIEHTSDGGYVFGGETKSYGAGSDDVWVVKLRANGDIQWERTFGGLESDFGCAIREAADGGYVVGAATESFGLGEDDFWVLKLDRGGRVPGCPFTGTSSATVTSTDAAGVDSVAQVFDSQARVSSTFITPLNSQASGRRQCYCETAAHLVHMPLILRAYR